MDGWVETVKLTVQMINELSLNSAAEGASGAFLSSVHQPTLSHSGGSLKFLDAASNCNHKF